ncbi:MAG: GxxExxY protein [Candidatus Saccharibacteria bacterium]
MSTSGKIMNSSTLDIDEYPFKDECYRIFGACMEVSNELGSGFLEAVYQEALCYEFSDQDIQFESQKLMNIAYKGRPLKKKYIADFICYGEIILEIKAIDSLKAEHTSQVVNYLKATGKQIGLLVNFGTSRLQYKRVIN